MLHEKERTQSNWHCIPTEIKKQNYILYIDFENYDWNTFHERHVSTWWNILNTNQQYNCLCKEHLDDSLVGFQSSWYVYLHSQHLQRVLIALSTKRAHCFVHRGFIVLSTGDSLGFVSINTMLIHTTTCQVMTVGPFWCHILVHK